MADGIERALFAAQEDLLKLELKKDARNPHFKNSYITLDELLEKVIPVLRQHEILLMQPPVETGLGDLALRTILYHIPSDSEVVSTLPLNKLQKDDPQGQGSAITYARRYALMSLLGLTADEDDDGNAASPRKKATKAKPRTKQQKDDATAAAEDETW